MTRLPIDLTDSITPMKLGDSQATPSPGRRIARAARVRPCRAPLVMTMSPRSSGAPRCAESSATCSTISGKPAMSVYWRARLSHSSRASASASRIAL